MVLITVHVWVVKWYGIRAMWFWLPKLSPFFTKTKFKRDDTATHLICDQLMTHLVFLPLRKREKQRNDLNILGVMLWAIGHRDNSTEFLMFQDKNQTFHSQWEKRAEFVDNRHIRPLACPLVRTQQQRRLAEPVF